MKYIFYRKVKTNVTLELLLETFHNAGITFSQNILSVETQPDSEAVVRKRSVKNMFLEILQNSQANTCARVSFLIKLQA